jgi:hypothetical protein
VTDTNVFPLVQPGTFADPLTEVLRNGARTLLAQAVETEVTGFLAGHADKLTDDGRQRLVRHGHLPERSIMTGIGPVAVRCPRVRDRVGDGSARIRFSSAILPPYARRSKSLEVLIPILYLKGVSTGDFEEALLALLGKDAGGLSASTIGRLKDAWSDEHARWSGRDLSAKRYVYFWADGIHVQARLEDEAQCLLVIIGATPEGKKELVGLIDGVRESAQSWKELLLDLKRRGLLLEGARGGLAQDPRATLLGAQDRQRPQQAAQQPAGKGQACTPGHLDGRDQDRCRGRVRCLHRSLRRQIRKGRRMPGQGSHGAARLLRLPCRALAASADHQPDRERVCHRQASNNPGERLPLKQDCDRHDLQAGAGRRKELAPPQGTRPVAESDPRSKVQRRNRGRQFAVSNRCRLIPTVTKIRR